MSLQKNEIKSCYYCGAQLLSGSYQMDHFPIPDRNGGIITVPACLPCHDAKDRLKFNQWNDEWVIKILEDFPKFNRETKIFLAKILAVSSDMANELKSKALKKGGE